MSGLLRFSKVLAGPASRVSGTARTPFDLMQQSLLGHPRPGGVLGEAERLCCIDGRQDGLGLWRRGSDGVGEFSEDCRELMPPIDIDAEFVVTAAQVLHKRVSRADHAGGA